MIHRGPELSMRDDLIDLPAQMNERLDRSIVELLGDVPSLLFLTEDDPSRVGFHEIPAAGLRGHVLEDDLHACLTVRLAENGRRRTEHHELSVDLTAYRRGSTSLARLSSLRLLGAVR